MGYQRGIAPPADARTPQQQSPRIQLSDIDNNQICGSVIGIQDQTLGEAVAVNGTAFRLHYQSDCVFGYAPARTLNISLSLGTKPLPASLIGINLEIKVGGRTFTQSFPPVAGLEHNFTWDGKDAYNRNTRGYQQISTSVGYTYKGVYAPTSIL